MDCFQVQSFLRVRGFNQVCLSLVIETLVIRNACSLISNPRWRATNPNMVLKPMVLSNYSEPMIEVHYGNSSARLKNRFFSCSERQCCQDQNRKSYNSRNNEHNLRPLFSKFVRNGLIIELFSLSPHLLQHTRRGPEKRAH